VALDSYAGLQAALGTWADDRTDLPAADLVTLAEARLNRDLRLRRMEAEAALTLAIGERTAPLPADFLEPLGLWIDAGAGRRALRFTPAAMETQAVAAPPRSWTVDGDAIAFQSPADQGYGLVLRYLQRFSLASAAPADGTQSNWLLQHWPDAYLASGNIEAALWTQDDEQAVRWEARYADALASINRLEARSQALTTLNADAAIQLRATGRGRFDINRGY